MGKSYESNHLLTSQKLVAELIGTYMLVFFGCGSAFIAHNNSITLEGAALTWAFVVIAIVYAIGHISGAHINPAASIALAAIGQFPWKLVPFYALAQLLGSIFASITLRLLFGGELSVLMVTAPVGPNPTSDLNVMICEIIVTFILMFVICCSILDRRAAKGLGGVAVGAAVFIDVIMAGTISGCSMNPARSIGPAIITQNFHKLWIYIISPILGALAGSSLYYFLQISKETEIESFQKHASPRLDIRLGNANPAYSERSMDLV